VNFNTVSITVSNRGVYSAEEQTPTLPIMKDLGFGLASGSYRLNISRTETDDRVLHHTGELFRALQRNAGIPGKGKIDVKKVPPELKPRYVHRSSKNVKDIIPKLMLYSNNFIANQLFLACGAELFGFPATWEKGRRAMKEFVRQRLAINSTALHLHEGSGLSRRNRMTPRAMLAVLRAFKPYYSLLPSTDDLYLKSGTLKGVFSYAGYVSEHGQRDGFVLILNQEENNRDELLQYIRRLRLRSLK